VRAAWSLPDRMETSIIRELSQEINFRGHIAFKVQPIPGKQDAKDWIHPFGGVKPYHRRLGNEVIIKDEFNNETGRAEFTKKAVGFIESKSSFLKNLRVSHISINL
jgi:hypothetical protein